MYGSICKVAAVHAGLSATRGLFMVQVRILCGEQ